MFLDPKLRDTNCPKNYFRQFYFTSEKKRWFRDFGDHKPAVNFNYISHHTRNQIEGVQEEIEIKPKIKMRRSAK